MSAQPLHAHTDDDHPDAKLELVHEPITTTLRQWAHRAGIADGSPGEVVVEIVFDTSNGNVRRAIVHRKLGADQLDRMSDT